MPDLINSSQAHEMLDLAVENGDVQLYHAETLSGEMWVSEGHKVVSLGAGGSSPGSHPGLGSLQLPSGLAPKPCFFGAE